MIELQTHQKHGYFTFGEINGQRIAYGNDTAFLVQVGRGKSSYRTKKEFKGDLAQAVAAYNEVNVSTGGKKRLLMPACSKNPVIARSINEAR